MSQYEVTNQKYGTLSEAEFVQMAALFFKAGYTVQRAKKRPPDKPKAPVKWFLIVED